MNILIRYLVSSLVFILALFNLLFPNDGGETTQAIAPLVAMGIASAAIKGVSGLAQMMKRRPEEVDYQIPPEVYQSLDLARSRAQGTSPMFQTQRETLESQTAAMARRATELGGPAAMGSLGRLQASQMAGTRDIDMMEENYQLQQEKAYRMELQNMAQYRDQEFDVNVLQPNERLWNEFYNARTAGQKNLMGAMDSVVSTTGTAMMQDSITKMLANQLGTGGEEEGESGIPEGGPAADYFIDESPYKQSAGTNWSELFMNQQYG